MNQRTKGAERYRRRLRKALALGYPSYYAYRKARWGPDPRSPGTGKLEGGRGRGS